MRIDWLILHRGHRLFIVLNYLSTQSFQSKSKYFTPLLLQWKTLPSYSPNNIDTRIIAFWLVLEVFYILFRHKKFFEQNKFRNEIVLATNNQKKMYFDNLLGEVMFFSVLDMVYILL